MASPRRVSTLLARLGAVVGFLGTYGVPVRYNVGPEGRWWERVRRWCSRVGGRLLDERVGPRPIAPGEYAGRLDCPPELLEQRLWERGFLRNPLSRLKHADGTPEFGSWVYRESPLAERQLHVMLFRGEDATTRVYAHEEASSVNPSVGYDHLDGEGQNVAAGVSRARRLLDLTVDASTTPTDGDWTENL